MHFRSKLSSYRIGVRPHCGICTYPMQVNDNFIMLIGNDDSTGFSELVGPCEFPDYDSHIPDENGVLRCRKTGCCTIDGPEASTCHVDCYKIITRFLNFNSSMDHLWLATAWQTPWQYAPHFRLQEPTVKLGGQMFDRLGLSDIRKLPMELFLIIYEYSSASYFWQLHSAVLFGQQFITPLPDNKLSISLPTILSWERGSNPITTDIPHELPLLRLTIDAWGLQEIKRLPWNLDHKTWRADDRVYVVSDQWKLANFVAQFRFGLLRLELPDSSYGLKTWDTPTPPYLRQCQLRPASIRPYTHFKTIDLSRTNGLTFFYSHGAIFAIHAHTKKDPCAQKTLELLHPGRRRVATWMYVPFSPYDSIVALGTPLSLDGKNSSLSSCWLFRMKLAGDVLVGLTHSTKSQRMVLSQAPPTTIVYRSVELESVFVIGAYSMDVHNSYALATFDSPVVGNPPLRNSFLSSASLENVAHVEVFTDESSDICNGLLLQYQNGAQRSLGQCRIGVDRVQRYTSPTYICYYRHMASRPNCPFPSAVNLVNFTNTRLHNHDGPRWVCSEMRGKLNFWFSNHETDLTILA